MPTFLSNLQGLVDLEFFIKFVVVYFFIIWIAIVIWVIKDISIRTNNVFFQILSVLLVVLGTPLGVFLYLIVRPGKTLYEKYYDEIEENLDIIAELLEERRKREQRESAPKGFYPGTKIPKKSPASTVEKTEKPSEKKYKLLAKTEETKKKKTSLKVKKF